MNELVCRLALTQVPGIGDVQARMLVQAFGSAEAVFAARRSALERLDGMGALRAGAIRAFRDFRRCEKEAAWLQASGVRPVFLTDPDYPARLLHCPDAPVLLFYKGAASLNAARMVAVVGTRHPTEYGQGAADALVRSLRGSEVTIVSGLAVGIDGVAHRAALAAGLPTVGVVAHGLDTLYPSVHAPLARALLAAEGGLLSEFFSGTGPDRHHFPLRNRIVSGLCDAVVVVETEVKGGSMITARLADGYHREVFAFPGRTTDRKSGGCNHLLQHSRAALITCGEDLMQAMGWSASGKAVQQQLFTDLPPPAAQVLQELRAQALHIDELEGRTGLCGSTLAAALLHLEMEGLVRSLAGKRYARSDS